MIPLKDDRHAHRTPLVSWTLLGLCVLVFLWQVSLGNKVQGAIYAYGLIPDVLLGNARLPPELAVVPAWLTVFTSMFLHGGWMHLIGNMLYIWIFADNVEDRFGHGRFLAFYLLCGVGAALAQALPDPRSQIPMVGASGAISGVLGAYMLMFPRAQVLVLLPLGPFMQMTRMPALAVLGLWFVIQLVSEIFSSGGAGVAFRAHIGGFITGLLLMPVFRPPR